MERRVKQAGSFRVKLVASSLHIARRSAIKVLSEVTTFHTKRDCSLLLLVQEKWSDVKPESSFAVSSLGAIVVGLI